MHVYTYMYKYNKSTGEIHYIEKNNLVAGTCDYFPMFCLGLNYSKIWNSELCKLIITSSVCLPNRSLINIPIHKTRSRKSFFLHFLTPKRTYAVAS